MTTISIILLIIIYVLSMIGGSSKAITDTLVSRYEQSIFNGISFIWDKWGPPMGNDGTWENKWKLDENGEVIRGEDGRPLKERFWLSSTLLSALTDPWHFFDLVRNITTLFIIPILLVIATVNSGLAVLWWSLGIPVTFLGTFHILYDWYLLIRK